MINDTQRLNEIRDAWEFVRSSRNVIVGNCNVATFAFGFNQAGIRNICFNLLLASAFSVLEETLQQLRDEGRFTGKNNRLGHLLANSQRILPWIDWNQIDNGRIERNQSVHDRTYLAHAKCRDYIAAIENQLVHWGVLVSAMPELWHW
jgi:hypothetical protein